MNKWPVRCIAACASIITVSYTHLDVYKRQGLAQAYAVYIKMGDPMAEEIRPLLNQLSKRAEAKIVEFFEKYSPDPERYFLAVALLEDAAVAFGSQFIIGEESSRELDDSVFKRIMDRCV